MMSSQGYKDLVNPADGKGLYWTSDINVELPIKVRQNGAGSERPFTLCELFKNTVEGGGDRPAMYVERGGKYISWTWKDYNRDVRLFSRACGSLNVKRRSACCVMGWNSPEWAIAFIGSIMYEAVASGIYSTNAPDACLYQAVHSEAEVIVVENNKMLQGFTQNLGQLPRVKAFVVYNEEKLPIDFHQDPRFFLWKDFLKLGESVPDVMADRHMQRQVPGQCCSLIYTSGTTGVPKGCMLSHDNLVWLGVEMMELLTEEKPELIGPQNRIVSYLPLSHIAGLFSDLIMHMMQGCELFFAKPDALQGTLVDTLKHARPTVFFAVPRVWEKFEEKLKEAASQAPAIATKISTWAKGYGSAHVEALMNKTDVPFMYSLANFLILSKIKQAIGLD